MTQEETLKRIEDDAHQYGSSLGPLTESVWQKHAVSDFIAGAKSERNKVLDELISKLDRGYKDYAWYKYLRLEIESLKVDL